MKILPVTEARFEHEGYHCVVLFMPMGHRCGYVGVPKTHPAYGKGYHELNIDCHGGLTYAENYLYNQDDAETWWLGFDCNHLGDEPDVEAAKKYFPEHYERMEKYGYYRRYPGSWPVPLAKAKAECMSIAEQLKQMECGTQPQREDVMSKKANCEKCVH